MQESIQESKMFELARQLLASSQAGKVKWEEGINSNSYTANLPEISLIITRTSREDLGYRLNLIDGKGRTIESLTSEVRLPRQNHDIMREIHDLARRSVMDVDENIDKALEYLRRV